MSAYHGIAGDVTEFADAKDAHDLISGDPARITESATAMAELGEAMTLAGEGLKAIDSSSWTGAAANNFRTRISGKPAQWDDAGTALLEISTALTTYRVVLDSSKDTAGRALHMWRGAQEATKRAITEHNKRVEVYNKAIDASSDPGPAPVYQDPGEVGRKEAEQMLDAARRRVTEAGYTCGRVISGWIGKAPAQPDWWDRLGMNIADSASFTVTGAVDLVEGVWEGVKGINSMARLVNPFDPYNISHPGAQMANMNKLASGLWQGVQNPEQFAKTVFDVETWKDSPGKALGKLLPDIALGVATGGGGFAGRTAAKSTVNAALDTATGGLFGLGQAGVGGVRKVGSMLGRDTDKLSHAAQDASKAGQHVPSNHTPIGQDAGIGVDYRLDKLDQTVPSLNVGGDLRSRIDNLAAWATSKNPETTTVSSVPPTPQPPVRQPPEPAHREQPPPPARQPETQPSRPAYIEPPTNPPPPLRPVQPPPELPASPPPPGTRDRATYDIGHRIQSSIEDGLKFKADMRDGFPNGNGIADRLTPTTPDTPHPHNDIPHTTEPDTPHEPATDQAPHTEPDLPEVRHIDPQTQVDVWNNAHNPDIDLRTMPDNLTWRSHDDGRPLYRVESGRDMHELFEDGLSCWNNELEHFDRYVHYNEKSGYVGTTTDPDLWMRHAVQDPDNMFVLEIDTRGGVDVESSRSGDYKILMKEESEVAYPGGIAAERIKGGYYVRVDPETGERFKVPGSWVDNPNYQPYGS